MEQHGTRAALLISGDWGPYCFESFRARLLGTTPGRSTACCRSLCYNLLTPTVALHHRDPVYAVERGMRDGRSLHGVNSTHVDQMYISHMSPVPATTQRPMIHPHTSRHNVRVRQA